MFFKKKIIWHKILDDASELAESRPALFEVEGKRLCIIKQKEEVFAIDDRCPHQGASLSEGYCEKKHIVCPWHQYAFSLNTGRQADNGGDYVDTFHVEIRPDGVFVGIENTNFNLF
jgi:nitrite reductase/ring-hydroxylating ferredoxin subunit